MDQSDPGDDHDTRGKPVPAEFDWGGKGSAHVEHDRADPQGLLADRIQILVPGRITGGAVLGGLLIFAPIGGIVWLTAGLIPGADIGLSALPGFIGTSLVVSVAMSLLSVAVNLARQDRTQPALDSAPSRFLERLPVRMRSAEIWAVEAEDHYLRVHTSAGQDLILLRMADAIAELAGQEGMQVHRSWWVARSAIIDARRGDGRATLTLKDGTEAPVSRTYAAELRRRGWI
jgi:hypothetical protein